MTEIQYRNHAKAPLLSVVICCYSGESFFEEAARSVVSQTYQDFTIILHDNGSSDRYSSLIGRVAAEIGAEVVRSEVNRYGEGLRYDILPFLKTPYLAILHDDDIFLPNKLALSMEALTSGKCDYVFTDRQYTDAAGRDLVIPYEEINTRPFVPDDYPYQFVADLFYRGLRFHFSTFVCKTSLAKLTLLGDPFLPRITDSLFAARLLLDRRFSGIALPDRLTRVRVHGGNDMLYDKFSIEDRGRETTLLSGSEYFIFCDVVFNCDDRQLARLLTCYPGISLVRDERTAALLQAAVMLAKEGRSKKLMAAFCVHQAFQRDPLGALSAFRDLTGSDLNSFMAALYQNYTHDEVWSFRAFLFPPTAPQENLGTPNWKAEDSALQALRGRLKAITSSTSWRLTLPLRSFFGVLRGQPAPAFHARRQLIDLVESYSPGEIVRLSGQPSVRYLFGGFAEPEAWGRWTIGPVASIVFRTEPNSRAAVLTLQVEHVFRRKARSSVHLTVNKKPLKPLDVSAGTPLKIRLAHRLLDNEGLVQIDIRPQDLKSPSDTPTNDPRALGIGLVSFSFDWED